MITAERIQRLRDEQNIKCVGREELWKPGQFAMISEKDLEYTIRGFGILKDDGTPNPTAQENAEYWLKKDNCIAIYDGASSLAISENKKGWMKALAGSSVEEALERLDSTLKASRDINTSQAITLLPDVHRMYLPQSGEIIPVSAYARYR